MKDQVTYSDAVSEAPAKLASGERLYIHELLDIRVKGRRDWLDTFSLWAENAAKAPEPRSSRVTCDGRMMVPARSNPFLTGKPL